MIYFNKYFKHLIVILVSIILVITAQPQGRLLLAEDSSNLKELLDDVIPGGWVKTDAALYNRENLYDYINGGAELYLSYGFQDLVTHMYQKEGQPDIIVDLFDMGTSENAFGVFTHSREEISEEFGQGSQYTAGLLLFWKDRYYVSILGSPETAESRAAVYDMAGKIDSRIKNKGELPGLLNQLPAENLIDVSVRYFKHHIWQNSYYFITEENIFHIGEQTDAIIAKYRDLGILMMVEYPTKEDAEKAFQSFHQSYMPENPKGGIIQIEDGSWTTAQVKDRLIKAVFNAPSEIAAQTLIEAVH